MPKKCLSKEHNREVLDKLVKMQSLLIELEDSARGTDLETTINMEFCPQFELMVEHVARITFNDDDFNKYLNWVAYFEEKHAKSNSKRVN